MNSFLRDWNPDLVVLIRIFRSNQDSTKISGFTHLSVSETLLARACIMMLTFSNWSLERPASSILFPSFRSSSSRFRTWTMLNSTQSQWIKFSGPWRKEHRKSFFYSYYDAECSNSLFFLSEMYLFPKLGITNDGTIAKDQPFEESVCASNLFILARPLYTETRYTKRGQDILGIQ